MPPVHPTSREERREGRQGAAYLRKQGLGRRLPEARHTEVPGLPEAYSYRVTVEVLDSHGNVVGARTVDVDSPTRLTRGEIQQAAEDTLSDWLGSAAGYGGLAVDTFVNPASARIVGTYRQA